MKQLLFLPAKLSESVSDFLFVISYSTSEFFNEVFTQKLLFRNNFLLEVSFKNFLVQKPTTRKKFNRKFDAL